MYYGVSGVSGFLRVLVVSHSVLRCLGVSQDVLDHIGMSQDVSGRFVSSCASGCLRASLGVSPICMSGCLSSRAVSRCF